MWHQCKASFRKVCNLKFEMFHDQLSSITCSFATVLTVKPYLEGKPNLPVSYERYPEIPFLNLGESTFYSRKGSQR